MKLIEHSDRYGLIAACCAAQGDIENACHWQKQAVELHKLCIGTDSDEFEEDDDGCVAEGQAEELGLELAVQTGY